MVLLLLLLLLLLISLLFFFRSLHFEFFFLWLFVSNYLCVYCGWDHRCDCCCYVDWPMHLLIITCNYLFHPTRSLCSLACSSVTVLMYVWMHVNVFLYRFTRDSHQSTSYTSFVDNMFLYHTDIVISMRFLFVHFFVSVAKRSASFTSFEYNVCYFRCLRFALQFFLHSFSLFGIHSRVNLVKSNAWRVQTLSFIISLGKCMCGRKRPFAFFFFFKF